MEKAVFIDRDGVLCKSVLNRKTGEYEAAQAPRDMKILPNVTKALARLQKSNYGLFLVSNQPDYAKGKTTLDALKKVHDRFDGLLTAKGIRFKEYYYCYHHPQGITPGYSHQCGCRKPGALSLFKAARAFHVSLKSSWMVGDRDSDVECGKNAGTKTILIEYPGSVSARGHSSPDYTVKDFSEAVNIILS